MRDEEQGTPDSKREGIPKEATSQDGGSPGGIDDLLSLTDDEIFESIIGLLDDDDVAVFLTVLDTGWTVEQIERLMPRGEEAARQGARILRRIRSQHPHLLDWIDLEEPYVVDLSKVRKTEKDGTQGEEIVFKAAAQRRDTQAGANDSLRPQPYPVFSVDEEDGALILFADADGAMFVHTESIPAGALRIGDREYELVAETDHPQMKRIMELGYRDFLTMWRQSMAEG